MYIDHRCKNPVTFVNFFSDSVACDSYDSLVMNLISFPIVSRCFLKRSERALVSAAMTVKDGVEAWRPCTVLPRVRKTQHCYKDVLNSILVRKQGMMSYYLIWSAGQLFTADCLYRDTGRTPVEFSVDDFHKKKPTSL